MNKLKGKCLLAYTAGIFDGEGSITIRKARIGKCKPSIQLAVAMGNTNEWLVQFFCMQFGGHWRIRGKNKRFENAKPFWEWQANGKEAARFLESILPYLQIKRPQAELAIEFQSRRIGRGHTTSDKQRAVDEAQKILMGKYNH